MLSITDGAAFWIILGESSSQSKRLIGRQLTVIEATESPNFDCTQHGFDIRDASLDESVIGTGLEWHGDPGDGPALLPNTSLDSSVSLLTTLIERLSA